MKNLKVTWKSLRYISASVGIGISLVLAGCGSPAPTNSTNTPTSTPAATATPVVAPATGPSDPTKNKDWAVAQVQAYAGFKPNGTVTFVAPENITTPLTVSDIPQAGPLNLLPQNFTDFSCQTVPRPDHPGSAGLWVLTRVLNVQSYVIGVVDVATGKAWIVKKSPAVCL